MTTARRSVSTSTRGAQRQDPLPHGVSSTNTPATRLQPCPHCFGGLPALSAAAAGIGLSLVNGRAIALGTPYLVTESLGRGRGRVWPLERRARGVGDSVERGSEIEPTTKRAALGGHGRMLRYALSDLVDGVYEAEAGPDGELAYFEVKGGRVGHVFDQRHAYAELKVRR